MLRVSMCAMNRSENSGCSCSIRIMSRFGIRKRAVRMTAVRRSHAQRLPGQAALAEEIARAEHGHDRLLAGRGQHGELHPALLDVEHAVRLCPLGEDDGASRKSHGARRHPR